MHAAFSSFYFTFCIWVLDRLEFLLPPPKYKDLVLLPARVQGFKFKSHWRTLHIQAVAGTKSLKLKGPKEFLGLYAGEKGRKC